MRSNELSINIIVSSRSQMTPQHASHDWAHVSQGEEAGLIVLNYTIISSEPAVSLRCMENNHKTLAFAVFIVMSSLVASFQD